MSDRELDSKMIEVADEVISLDNKIKRLCRQRKQKQLELKKLAVESWQRMLAEAEVIAEDDSKYYDDNWYVNSGRVIRIKEA
jgi:hypothetical protein